MWHSLMLVKAIRTLIKREGPPSAKCCQRKNPMALILDLSQEEMMKCQDNYRLKLTLRQLLILHSAFTSSSLRCQRRQILEPLSLTLLKFQTAHQLPRRLEGPLLLSSVRTTMLAQLDNHLTLNISRIQQYSHQV